MQKKSIPHPVQQGIQQPGLFFGDPAAHLLIHGGHFLIDERQEFQAFLGNPDINLSPVGRTEFPGYQLLLPEFLHQAGGIAHAIQHTFLYLAKIAASLGPPEYPQDVVLLMGELERLQHLAGARIQPAPGEHHVQVGLVYLILEFLLLQFFLQAHMQLLYIQQRYVYY